MSSKLMSAVAVVAALVIFGSPAMAAKKCFVDEGNGRKTPCDAMLKHQTVNHSHHRITHSGGENR